MPLKATDIPVAQIPHIDRNFVSSHNMDPETPTYPIIPQTPGTWYKITGCLTGQNADGTWPPRKEFDEFIKDYRQTALFFIALEELCTRQLEDRLSYFQLGGKYTASFLSTEY